MISKIIHYCWFGNKPKSKLIKKCIASWEEYFPDFTIKEWNESNIDLEENEYIKKAYFEKKWAFVSDYVRMKVLYEYGGIYFDTDVEVLKRFPDEILELPAFTGMEDFSLKVSPGLVFACEPGNEIAWRLIRSYNEDSFELDNVDNIKTINARITEMLVKDGLQEKNMKQIVDGITIFPSSVFCGYDGARRCIDIQPDTLSVHHYASSWFPWHRKIRKMFGTIKRRILN